MLTMASNRRPSEETVAGTCEWMLCIIARMFGCRTCLLLPFRFIKIFRVRLSDGGATNLYAWRDTLLVRCPADRSLKGGVFDPWDGHYLDSARRHSRLHRLTEYRGSINPSSDSTNASLNPALTTAADYLLAGYNRHLGLIPETPGSSVYWLYSDNFLAARALLQYGQGNGTMVAIGQNISETVQGDSALTSADNQYATSLGGGPCQIHRPGTVGSTQVTTTPAIRPQGP